MDKNTLVTVCAIMHDVGPVIAAYLEEMSAVLDGRYEHYEIVLVDNGSDDDTVAVVRDLMQHHRHLRLLVLTREYDEQVAFTAALENSIGDYVVIMDLNTDPPQLVPQLVAKAMTGADIVTAEIAGRRQSSSSYALLSRLFYRLSNLLTDTRLDLNWSNFVCFSRKMVNAILQIKDRVRYLKYLQTEIGYGHQSLRYEQINRSGRPSRKANWSRFFFAVEALASNSERLLRLATSLALLTSLASAGYLVYALVIRLFRSDVAAGWTSISVVLAVMFSVLFFILFVIGQYLSLVYKEARKAPLYHVAEEFNSSVLFEKIRERNVI